MTNLPTATADKAKALEIADAILERLQSNRLTKVPLLHLDELPPLSGVYLAATDNDNILYVGKANDFTVRCKIGQHQKLPTAIELGATCLLLAKVPDGFAWAVEQKLIAELEPPLNDLVNQWWIQKTHSIRSPKESLRRRKRITLSIDDTLIDAAKRVAHSQNNSLSRFVESLIADKAIELGEVDGNYMTPGETRGRKSEEGIEDD
jgi:hypothetical protein